VKYFLRIPVALLLLFLAAVALTIYIVTQTTIVHRLANHALATYIESRYDVDIKFGDIGGSLLKNLVVNDIRVTIKQDSLSYRIGKIDRLEVYYNVRELLKANWVVDSVRVESPAIILRSDKNNKPILPSFNRGESEKSTVFPDIKINSFILDNAQFNWERSPQPLFVDSLTLAGRGEYKDGVLHAKLDSIALSLPVKGFRLRDLSGEVAVSNRQLGIDTLYVQTDSSHVNLSGVMPFDPKQPFAFSFRDSYVSLAEIGLLIGKDIPGGFKVDANLTGELDDFSGKVSATGSLFDRKLGPLKSDFHFDDGVLAFSNLDGSFFDGTMKGDADINFVTRPETYKATLDVKHINFEKIVPKTFASNLNGKMELYGSGLGDNTFNIDLYSDLGPGSYDWVRYDSLQGAISLNVNDMYFHPGFSLFYKNSEFSAEGVVNYDGQMNLKGDFATSQLADFWGDVFIKELSGPASASYVVDGPVLDPNIRGTFVGDSNSFYGFSTDSLYADFDIQSFLYGRRGNVKVKSWKSDVWNLPAESVTVALEIDSNLVDVDSARLYADRYEMDADGQATIIDSTADVTVNNYRFTFDSLSYVAVAPIHVAFEADQIVVDRADIVGDGGRFSFSTRYGYDSTIDLSVQTDSFQVAPWLVTLGIDSLLTGDLSLTGELTGRLANPSATLTGRISGLSYGPDTLGTLDAELSFADSSVEFSRLKLDYFGYEVRATGEFPFVMNLDTGAVYVPEDSIRLKLTSDGDDLSILSSVNPDLESLTGDFVSELDIYGTPQHPETRGYFYLENGTAKIYEMQNPIEDLEIRINTQGKLVNVDWIEGKVRDKNREGTVRAAGEIHIINKDVFDYDVAVVGFDVPFRYDLGDIYARADVDLQISGSTPPTVTGDVIVYEAEYLDEFEDEEVTAAIRATETSDLWNMSINVEMLPASVKVRNSDVNMVVDGNVQYLRQAGKENYLGRVNIVRGNFYLFDMSFEIETGSYLEFSNVEQPDPDLHVMVTTNVRTYASDVTTAGYDQLRLQIGGTLLQPEINAASGSPYTDADILTLLLANQSASSGEQLSGSGFQERLGQGLTGYFATVASQRLSRRLGVELFEIRPVYGEKNTIQGASVSLGFYTLPNVYTYVSSLTTEGRADYGIEYRLGRHFLLGGSYNRENLWQLDLNLNWEFR